MKSNFASAVFHRLCLFLSLIIAVLTLGSSPGMAQPAEPTIMDFRVSDNTLFLDITLNAEAAIAGVDPSGSSASAQYQKLRRLVSSELEPELHDFIRSWSDTLGVEVGGPVELAYEGARIPVVGDPNTARMSHVLLAGDIPDGAGSLRLTWPAGLGAVVLRQQGVDAPYTGYLEEGQTSPLIPLQGGAGLDAAQTLEAFFPKGISSIIPAGPQQVLFALAVLFLSARLRAVVSQMLVLSVGLTLSLVLGAMGVFNVQQTTVAQLVPASIVVLAVWNLFARKAGFLRLLAVFLATLPQGMALSHTLSGIGIPPDRVPPAILGYLAGALLVLLAVMIATSALTIVLSRNSYRYRGRISVLASMMIALVGLYLSAAALLPL